jgi:hypothetical protein
MISHPKFKLVCAVIALMVAVALTAPVQADDQPTPEFVSATAAELTATGYRDISLTRGAFTADRIVAQAANHRLELWLSPGHTALESALVAVDVNSDGRIDRSERAEAYHFTVASNALNDMLLVVARHLDQIADTVSAAPNDAVVQPAVAANSADTVGASEVELMAARETEPAEVIEPDYVSLANADASLDLSSINVIGTAGGADDMRALMRMPSGAFMSVERGDTIRGYQVAAVADGSVILVRNGQSHTLSVPD